MARIWRQFKLANGFDIIEGEEIYEPKNLGHLSQYGLWASENCLSFEKSSS